MAKATHNTQTKSINHRIALTRVLAIGAVAGAGAIVAVPAMAN